MVQQKKSRVSKQAKRKEDLPATRADVMQLHQSINRLLETVQELTLYVKEHNSEMRAEIRTMRDRILARLDSIGYSFTRMKQGQRIMQSLIDSEDFDPRLLN